MAASRNPELARLLATLNNYTSSQNSIPTTGNDPTQQNITNSAGVQVNKTSTHLSIPGLGNSFPEPISFPATSQHRSFTPANISTPIQSATSSTPQPIRSDTPNNDPIPDASTITNWPAALKHVTKHLALNVAFAARIKQLIKSQHTHERQWHTSREAIISRQNSREGTTAQVSALLRSLGGRDITTSTSSTNTAEKEEKTKQENERELRAYDAKVYKGLVDMAADFDRQLRKLGVPFFAIKWDLVVLEHQLGKDGVERKGKLDKGELRELQGRMIQLLEDLFGD